MGTADADRRLNLYFDDLDQDILDWLNTFGKRKRARIAKEAIRKYMNEGSRISPSAAFNNSHPGGNKREVEQKSVPKEIITPSGPVRERNIEPNSNSPNVLDTLINLVGVENDSDILNYLDLDKNEGAIP